MSAEPSAAGPSRNPRTYGSNARSASLPYPHPSQSTPRNPLPAQQAIADTPFKDIPHRPARERTGRPMMSLPADEQGEAADTREERESSEEVVCTGHLFEGKNRLGKINPSRAAKAKAAQQPKTWIPSRQRSIPAFKLEPGVDGKEGDSYVYNKAHAVKKAHLPPGTLFEGARVMDDEEIARMVDVLRKGPIATARYMTSLRILKESPQVWQGEDECNCCQTKDMGSNGSTRHPYDELPCIVSISSQSKKCVRCCILELACFNGVVWKTSTDLTFPDGTIGKAHLKLRGARAHSRNADTEGADQVLQDDGSASLGGAVAATADSEADDPVMTIDLEGALPTGAMKVEGGVADGSMVASASGTTQDPIAEGEEVDMEGDESMVTAEGEESMVAAADNIVEDGYEPRSETGLSEDLQHHFRRERTRTPSPSPQPRSPSVRAARQTLDGSDIGNDIVAVDLQKEVTLLRQRLAEVEREKNDMAELLANKDRASRQAQQMWQARDAAWEELSTHLYHECDPKDPTPASQLHTELFSEMDNLKKLTELPKVQKSLPDGCGTFLANAVQEVEGLIHRAVGEAQSGVGGEAMEVDRPSLEVLLAELPVKPGHYEQMKE